MVWVGEEQLWEAPVFKFCGLGERTEQKFHVGDGNLQTARIRGGGRGVGWELNNLTVTQCPHTDTVGISSLTFSFIYSSYKGLSSDC